MSVFLIIETGGRAVPEAQMQAMTLALLFPPIREKGGWLLLAR